MSTASIALLVALALLNAFVSCRLAVSPKLSGSQKAAQIALIWLLPVAGVAICLMVASTADRHDVELDRTAFAEGPGGEDTGIVDSALHGPISGDFDGAAGAFDGGGDGGGGGD